VPSRKPSRGKRKLTEARVHHRGPRAASAEPPRRGCTTGRGLAEAGWPAAGEGWSWDVSTLSVIRGGRGGFLLFEKFRPPFLAGTAEKKTVFRPTTLALSVGRHRSPKQGHSQAATSAQKAGPSRDSLRQVGAFPYTIIRGHTAVLRIPRRGIAVLATDGQKPCRLSPAAFQAIAAEDVDKAVGTLALASRLSTTIRFENRGVPKRLLAAEIPKRFFFLRRYLKGNQRTRREVVVRDPPRRDSRARPRRSHLVTGDHPIRALGQSASRTGSASRRPTAKTPAPAVRNK